MNALVKKEIRLLLPSWIVATLLALPPACTRSDDGIPVFVLFLGLTMMALTSIGRETSLNTFSSLLSQPMERITLWRTKLSVLAGAFLVVFIVWRLAILFSFKDYHGSAADPEASAAVIIAGSLVLVSAFTGGLWASLLLRQIAGAFWLTLLVPAVLAGFTAAILAKDHSDYTIITVLCVVLGVYAVGGFLFARWLFFRAQDVGWTGGIISLPEWKFFAASSDTANSTRIRKPIFALVKKEFQLQQASLMGAAGLLVLHIGVVALRSHHKFARDSAGEILTSVFWMLWLVLPVMIGSMAVAEERRLGTMEGQLCLPVSRRIQFAVKAIITLGLGIFLGGVLPMLLEYLATSLGAQSLMFVKPGDNSGIPFFWLAFFVLSAATWLTLLGFFGSTISRSFLQAVGFGIATFFISCTSLTINWREIFPGYMPAQRLLPMIIAVPTIIVTLLWLGYLNFKDFRPGWPLWRRNLLGLVGAVVFVTVASIALYNRVWEIVEPAEPPHGPAKLSLTHPPSIQIVRYNNLLVRLPDGRVWFDGLGDSAYDKYGGTLPWQFVWQKLAHPLRESLGPRQFLAGSNWVVATTEHMYLGWIVRGKQFFTSDFTETVGIQPDGTLWLSTKPEPTNWTAGALQQYGSETNWRQLAQASTSIVLLKGDGTLWRWGCLTNELHRWPGLRAFTPHQIGTNSDWQELFTLSGIFARQKDGRVWHLTVDWKTGQDKLDRTTNYDEIISLTASCSADERIAFIRADGTLWMRNRYWDKKTGKSAETGILQVGKEDDWRAVAINEDMIVALKSDGSLWQWHFFEPWNMNQEHFIMAAQKPPARVGIHNDWVAIASTWGNVIALAADGSLWLWPDREQYEQSTLLKLPKQPQFLGNVFGKPD